MAAILIVVGLAAATVGPGASWTTVLAAQDDPAAPTIEIGAGPQGDTALALVGLAAIGEDGLRLVGYVTRVIGLDPALLATEPGPPTAATARFTFAADLPDARQPRAAPRARSPRSPATARSLSTSTKQAALPSPTRRPSPTAPWSPRRTSP
jgi:hypothetical protein